MDWLVHAHGSCLQATGSWDATIRIWDLRTGTPEVFHQELEGHSGNISCLCYSASGLLVSWAALSSRPFCGPVSVQTPNAWA